MLSIQKCTRVNVAEWLREVMHHLKLEKLRHTIQGLSEKFDRMLKPFINYITAKLSPRPSPVYPHYELSRVYLLS